jgi:hypothetical protein
MGVGREDDATEAGLEGTCITSVRTHRGGGGPSQWVPLPFRGRWRTRYIAMLPLSHEVHWPQQRDGPTRVDIVLFPEWEFHLCVDKQVEVLLQSDAYGLLLRGLLSEETRRAHPIHIDHGQVDGRAPTCLLPRRYLSLALRNRYSAGFAGIDRTGMLSCIAHGSIAKGPGSCPGSRS